MSDNYFMEQALLEAKKAFKKGEVPVGAVVVIDEKIIARAHNLREKQASPISHAEINAIVKASKKLNRWILDDATIYITVEPCMMCVGAILQARMKRVVYGAPQEKFGALGGVINLLEDNPFNHQLKVTKGLLEDESIKLMKEFFKNIRN